MDTCLIGLTTRTFFLKSILSESESVSGSVVSNPLRPRGLQPAKLLCPCDSSGKNTVVGCHSLLQGLFLTQASNPSLPHCRQILHHLSHQGSPKEDINFFILNSKNFWHHFYVATLCSSIFSIFSAFLCLLKKSSSQACLQYINLFSLFPVSFHVCSKSEQ